MKHSAIKIITSVILINILFACTKPGMSYSHDGVVSDSIFYTDINPDSVILKLPIDTFYLDLNNDGINDFQFIWSYTVDNCSDNLLGTYARDNSFLIAPISNNNAIITDGFGKAFAIDSASEINTDSLWAPSSQILLYGSTEVRGHCATVVSSIKGFWLNGLDKYVGLKFYKGNNTYYGWARLTSTYTVSSLNRNILVTGNFIIKGYAYNATPNRPILAGQRQ